MGSLGNLVSMLPGVGNALKGKEIDEKVFVRTEAIILSMTYKERENPNILNGMRRRRIANGSGTTIQEVNRVIKHFDEMQKLMKGFNKGKLRNLMKKMNISPDALNQIQNN
jgi:signal recognition particle subunit SRP54